MTSGEPDEPVESPGVKRPSTDVSVEVPTAALPVPRFDSVHRCLRLIGALLLVVGVSGAVAAPFLEWDSISRESLELDRRFWLLVPAPLVTVVFLVSQRFARLDGWKRMWLAVPVISAGFATWLAVGYMEADPGYRTGLAGHVFVLSGVALMTGWILRAVWPADPTYRIVRDAGLFPSLAAGLAVALTIVVGLPATTWLLSGRDHTTADPLPETRSVASDDLARERWRADSDQLEWAATSGRYLVARNRFGIQVRDALSGKEHWHYYRRDLEPVAAEVTSDGKAVVALFRESWPDTHIAVGLEIATGEPRWEWKTPRPFMRFNANYTGGFASASSGGAVSSAFTFFRPAQWIAAAGDTIVLADGKCFVLGWWVGCRDSALVALDARTGEEAWRWGKPSGCDPHGVAVSGATVAVAVECSASKTSRKWLADEVIALSASSGQEQWRQRVRGPRRWKARIGDLLSTSGGFVVRYGGELEYKDPADKDTPDSWMWLDSSDGSVRGTHRALSGGMWSVNGLAVYDLGSTLVGVDLGSGDERWRTAKGWHSGNHPAGFVTDGDTGYVIRLDGEPEWRTDRTVRVQIVGLDLDNGKITGERVVALGEVACADGPCDRDEQYVHGGLSSGGLVVALATPSRASHTDIVAVE